MSVVLVICMLAVTLSLVAIAVVTVRAMARFERAAEELAKTAEAVRSSVERAEVVTREAEGLAAALRAVVPHVRRTAERFEAIGERTARLSAVVLDEVETPIRTALAMATGVRSGARALIRAWARRSSTPDTRINGGIDS
jgi:uncharacterized protein YoxC